LNSKDTDTATVTLEITARLHLGANAYYLLVISLEITIMKLQQNHQ